MAENPKGKIKAEMLRKTMTIRREDIAYDDETEDDEPWPDE